MCRLSRSRVAAPHAIARHRCSELERRFSWSILHYYKLPGYQQVCSTQGLQFAGLSYCQSMLMAPRLLSDCCGQMKQVGTVHSWRYSKPRSCSRKLWLRAHAYRCLESRKEPRANGQKPRARSQGPKSQGPRAKSCFSTIPGTHSHAPEARLSCTRTLWRTAACWPQHY